MVELNMNLPGLNPKYNFFLNWSSNIDNYLVKELPLNGKLLPMKCLSDHSVSIFDFLNSIDKDGSTI